MARILVVDDDPNVLTTSCIALTREGHQVARAETYLQFEEFIKKTLFDVVITDLRLENYKTGIDVLTHCKNISPETCVIIITAFSSVDSAVAAIREGASDYLVKPCGADQVILSVNRVLEKRAMLYQIRSLQREIRSWNDEEVIGDSLGMQQVRKTISLVAGTDCTVLIVGETGTGKDLVARAIHRQSHLHDRPFVAISCAALPENLLESEMFGHVKGAFSGAVTNKRGLIMEAEGGTLFLDEIGDLPMALQAKLLRFIEQGEVRPVGSNKNLFVKVRLLAATNRDLEEAVRKKEFRSDLYYRLRVMCIHLPPLRERGQDVLVLANHFLHGACEKKGIPERVFSPGAKARLRAYPWPGNVRELRYTVERAVILADGQTIQEEDLDLPNWKEERKSAISNVPSSLALTDITRQHLLDVLELCRWNQKHAAGILKISKATLWRKLRAYGIDISNLKRSYSME